MNEPLTMLDHALRLHGQGHHIIPLGKCREKPPAWFKRRHKSIADAMKAWPKAPRISTWKQYQKEQPSVEQVEQWWSDNPDANIGLLTGITVNVVDCDGRAAADWVRMNLPFTPLTVDTANGTHFYYDADTDIKNSAIEGKGIDVRGHGGYVVAAGSIHSTGVIYTEQTAQGIPCNDHTDLPKLTAVEVNEIKVANKQQFNNKPAKKKRTGESRTLVKNASALKELKRGASVSEGGRNNAIAVEVGKCYAQGWSIERTLEYCLKVNEGYNPPLGSGEVQSVVESVANTREDTSGDRPPETKEEESDDFEEDYEQDAEEVIEEFVEEVVEGKRVRKVKPPRKNMLVSLGEYEEFPAAEPEMFWHERAIFRGSRCLLAGEPKIGKSRFVLAMLCAAATGREFMGHKFNRPYRCAWVQGEIHASWLSERVEAVTKAFSEDEMITLRQNLFLTDRLEEDLMTAKSRRIMLEDLSKHAPDIVVFDPIAQLSSAEENSNKEVSELLRHVNKFVKDLECALFIVHHTKQADKNATPDFTLVRGASAFRAWFDTGILLTGEAKKPLISFEIRNGASIPSFNAKFDNDLGIYKKYIAASGTEKGRTIAQTAEGHIEDVRKLIAEKGAKGITRKQIEKKLGEMFGLSTELAARAIAYYSRDYQHYATNTIDGGQKFTLEVSKEESEEDDNE